MEVELKQVDWLSASTIALRFVPLTSESIKFRPGQFFRFTFSDDLGDFERSYSLCNLDDSVNNGEISTSKFDLVISSAMDLQTKLANDGLAQTYKSIEIANKIRFMNESPLNEEYHPFNKQ